MPQPASEELRNAAQFMMYHGDKMTWDTFKERFAAMPSNAETWARISEALGGMSSRRAQGWLKRAKEGK